VIDDGNRKLANEIFTHENRPIFAYSIKDGDVTRHIFFDNELKSYEETDNIFKMNSDKNFTKEKLIKENEKYGMFVIETTLELDAKTIYEKYKFRNEVEISINTYKNTLEFDRTFMQNSETLEGLLLLNHISLIIIEKIYSKLRKANLLSKYSIHGLFKKLRKVRVTKHTHSEIEK
jgi:transposase